MKEPEVATSTKEGEGPKSKPDATVVAGGDSKAPKTGEEKKKKDPQLDEAVKIVADGIRLWGLGDAASDPKVTKGSTERVPVEATK